MAKLGELGKIITGNTPKTSDAQNYESNDICFVKPSDFTDNEITEIHQSEFYISAYAKDKARVLPTDSILVTCIGTIGKVAINKVPCAFNQQINAIVPEKKVCNPRYIAYAIQNLQPKMQSTANAAVVPILNKTQFSNLEVPLLPVGEQKQIACNLNKIDKLISLRKQQLAKLDELVKARFVEMFGDPSNNPMGWKKQNFEDIALLITDGEHMTPQRTNKGIYLLSARNILNHTIQLDDVDYIDEEEYGRIARRIVPQQGDVLVSCSGSIGRCCVVPSELKFQMVRSVALIRFNNTINPIFAEWLIATDELQKQIYTSATQSSQANLFQGKIRKLCGYVPPLSLQNQFAAFVERVDKQKQTVQQSLEKLELMKKVLMQEYFG